MVPETSVIVVNWNGKGLLEDCLTGLSRQSYRSFECILVDNGSQDDSVAFVHRRFPWVQVLPLKRNHGFAGGNNRGLAAARGEFIALLNNDAVADEDWLISLRKGMDRDLRIGICASRILVAGTGLIDSAGDGFSTALRGFKRGEGSAATLWNEEAFCLGACAGAAFYRRSMLSEIGFFDEDFFLSHEDTDLNLRAQLAGWKCLYCPAAVVHHRVGATQSRMGGRIVTLGARNVDWVRLKDVPAPLFLRFAAPLLFGDLASALYFCSGQGRRRAYLRGRLEAWRAIPLVLGKRRVIQSRRGITPAEFARMMTPLREPRLCRQKVLKLWRTLGT